MAGPRQDCQQGSTHFPMHLFIARKGKRAFCITIEMTSIFSSSIKIMEPLASSEVQIWSGRPRHLHKPRSWLLLMQPLLGETQTTSNELCLKNMVESTATFPQLFVLFCFKLGPLSYQDPCFPPNLRILPPALPLSLSACFGRPLSYLVPSHLSQAIQTGHPGADVFLPGSSRGTAV